MDRDVVLFRKIMDRSPVKGLRVDLIREQNITGTGHVWFFKLYAENLESFSEPDKQAIVEFIGNALGAMALAGYPTYIWKADYVQP
jgi:hypothetical protein